MKTLLVVLGAVFAANVNAAGPVAEAPITRPLAVPTQTLSSQKAERLSAAAARSHVPTTVHGSFVHTHADGSREIVCNRVHNPRAIHAPRLAPSVEAQQQ